MLFKQQIKLLSIYLCVFNLNTVDNEFHSNKNMTLINANFKIF